MIGTLGRKIIFEVSDEKVLTFLNMTREITSRWAEHEALGVKPKPEFLGPGLQTGTLEITLSATLGVKPRAILEAVEAMVSAGIINTPEYWLANQDKAASLGLLLRALGGAAAAGKPAKPAAKTYTVAKGDTLGKIAAKYGTTVAKLVAANGIRNANLIHVGQVLTIPE